MKQKVNNTINYSVIILAAGKSSRMGIPKWSLQYDEKSSFIEHIISEYHSFGCKEIILVINETDYSSFVEKNYWLPENVVVVINNHPEWDRFYSLKLGSKKLEKVHPIFIHNVDNPFVNPSLLKKMIENRLEADVIVPEFQGKGGHPILLNYRAIEKVISIQENILHFKEFLNQFKRKRVITNEELILININSTEDYLKYFKVK